VGSSPAGDFERFFAAAKPSLLRQAFVYTGNLEEAQDLAQETLLRVWRNWGRVSRLEAPEAWARKVLHNLAVGSWRRRRTRRRHAAMSRGDAIPDRTSARDVRPLGRAAHGRVDAGSAREA
jgi:DNA-directed RNA polymerase specialized sigma24 family protein